MCADSTRLVHPLFQEEGGGSTPTSALQLSLVRVTHAMAKVLNRLWHSRLPRLTSPQHRVSFAAEYDGLYYAVAIWCRPIAGNRTGFNQYEAMELQRFAIAPDAPRNTASRMLGVMARLIRRDFPDIKRLISYQDIEAHAGTIYRAAGWLPTETSKGDEWDRPSRRRRIQQSAAPKRRWEKSL